ncbi:SUMF1/EgtB/PvdO family nonheme iron enzyme [Geobacter sp. FeAm09]|uniref:SUMF1/EgtB/PvdO family nonheme iron enzyme n=1 Tax=Geobacter sp. FeAm09 TaxID=2597769 RepID=UPI001F103297|nr:SUMF1/EgtB/PvdO family nonheme iron enzyme [Geobacter sp. FeAm09]
MCACAAVSLVLAFSGAAFGAVSEGQFSVSPMIGGYTYDGGQHLDTAPMYSLRGGYNLTDRIGVEAGLDYSITSSRLKTDKNVAIFKYGVEGLYHFMPDKKLVPFVAAGLGGYNLSGPSTLVSRKLMGFMDYGGGVKYFLYDRLALRADVRHVVANASAFEYTLGVTIPFGGAKGQLKPVSAPAAPKSAAGKSQGKAKVAQEVPLKKPAEEKAAQKKAVPPVAPAETPAPSQQTAKAAGEPAVKAMPAPAVVVPTEVTDTAFNMQLVSIPDACYTMGDPSGKALVPHEVCLSAFSISKLEITRELFQQFVESSNYVTDAEKNGGCYTITAGKETLNPAATWKNPDFYQSKKDPVVCVSWNDAQAFTTWLSQSSGKKYRLPTEAEWELAARSGGKQEKYAGTGTDADLYRFANFCDKKCIYEWNDPSQNDGYWSTAPVGKYAPNGFGLKDMSGNVAEWVQDYFAEDYYAASPRMNPKGPGAGTGHTVRGGSWRSQKDALSVTSRGSAATGNAYDNIGFRVCREP